MAQDGVSRAMTVDVVEVLEAVDVAIDQDTGVPEPPGTDQGAFKLLRESATVKEAGQFIGEGEALKIFNPLILGRDLLFRLRCIHQRAFQKCVLVHLCPGFFVGNILDQSRCDNPDHIRQFWVICVQRSRNLFNKEHQYTIFNR